MPKAYSSDMRGRVIARVESGGSRREAAEHYDVSASAAVIWVKCFHETGRCAAKPRGGNISLGEEARGLFAGAIDAHRIRRWTRCLLRFFHRQNITFKKSLRAAEQERADAARADGVDENRARWTRRGGVHR